MVPEYQEQDIRSKLFQPVKDNNPALLYFGSQSEAELFMRKTCVRKFKSYIMRNRMIIEI